MLLACLIWAALGTWMYACCGLKVAVPWTAMAILLFIVVPAASAGIDNPMKFDGIHVIHRCPKLTSPIECTGGGKDHHAASRAIQDIRSHHVPGVKACTLNRDLYEYHHGLTGKPRALRGYTGCKLYAIDAAYHRSVERLHFTDSLQEAAERVLSDMGVAPSDLGHIALTASPQ